MKKNQENSLVVSFNIIVSIALFWATSCSGLPQQVFSAPEKNVIPDYLGSVTKHQVLDVIWRVQLVDPGHVSLESHHYGCPAVSKDGKRVFAGAKDGSFYCLEASTGNVLWRNLTNGPIECDPYVTDDIIYVGSSDGNIYAYRSLDGEKLWSFSSSQSFTGRLELKDDRLVAMTNADSLFCLDAQTGKLIWSYRRDAPFGLFKVKGVASPLVVDDTVYAGFSDGSLVALSLEGGKVQSTKNYAKSGANFKDMDSDPIYIDPMLVTGSFSGGIVALDRKSLDEIWRYQVEGPSSMAVDADGQIIYFSTAASKIFALSAKDGKPAWSFSARKGSLSRPLVSKNWLLISSSEYSLLVLDRSSGKLIQMFNPGKGSHSAPVVHNNRSYWVSNGEVLYAMEIRR